MSRQKMGLFGALATVGAVGAVAGFAWRWMQRHRGAGSAPYRDLNRWEGEGGALAGATDPASEQNTTASRSMSSERTVATESPNGGAAQAWPFPHGTRH